MQHPRRRLFALLRTSIPTSAPSMKQNLSSDLRYVYRTCRGDFWQRHQAAVTRSYPRSDNGVLSTTPAALAGDRPPHGPGHPVSVDAAGRPARRPLKDVSRSELLARRPINSKSSCRRRRSRSRRGRLPQQQRRRQQRRQQPRRPPLHPVARYPSRIAVALDILARRALRQLRPPRPQLSQRRRGRLRRRPDSRRSRERELRHHLGSNWRREERALQEQQSTITRHERNLPTS